MTQPEYIEGNGFIAEVVRTARIKTATIKVKEGVVSVVVPRKLSGEQIAQLLKEKNSWIKKKITLHREVMPVRSKQYVSGESFAYLGRNYRLKVLGDGFAPVKLIHGQLVVTLPSGSKHPHMTRNALIRWYKQRAELKLQEKVKRYADMVGVEPREVRIKTFKSRWGSCCTKGNIDFNWKVVLAPNRIVDYVVVHELCHLKQHDHSPKFWKEVERVMPDYADCKQWLKLNGGQLEI